MGNNKLKSFENSLCIGLEVRGGSKYSFILCTLRLITKNERISDISHRENEDRSRRLCNESIKMELADRRLKGM